MLRGRAASYAICFIHTLECHTNFSPFESTMEMHARFKENNYRNINQADWLIFFKSTVLKNFPSRAYVTTKFPFTFCIIIMQLQRYKLSKLCSFENELVILNSQVHGLSNTVPLPYSLKQPWVCLFFPFRLFHKESTY